MNAPFPPIPLVPPILPVPPVPPIPLVPLVPPGSTAEVPASTPRAMMTSEDRAEVGTARRWSDLWHELVEHARCHDTRTSGDYWAGRAEEFQDRATLRAPRSETLRRFVADKVSTGSSVLDIGAGTGSWSVFLAERAGTVTALDNSPAMIQLLRRNVAAAGVRNVEIVEGTWPEIEVDEHDYSLAAHSMYGCQDLPSFVLRMTAMTRRACFLVVRAPLPDGVISEAADHLWGGPLDSPGFPVAYNVLLELGLLADVLVEPGPPTQRTSATMADALARLKRQLGLSRTGDHDAYLTTLLGQRLEHRDGMLVWPPENRSVLVHWELA